MNKNPLHVLPQDSNASLPPRKPRVSSTHERAEAIRAQYERLWLRSPEMFKPDRTAIERARVESTWKIVQELLPNATTAAELGMGWGVFTRRLAGAGLRVDAVDVSELAIKHFDLDPVASVHLIREAVPYTSLPDQHYDIVVCADLVGDLHQTDQRLLISELYRIVKPTGWVVLSTGLDIDSEGAVDQLAKLIDTELKVERWSASYHVYFLRLLQWLRRPELYLRAKHDPAYREKQMAKRSGVGRQWLKLQTWAPCCWLWQAVSWITRPLANQLEQSNWMLKRLDSLCRTMKSEDGVSHVVCIAKRKSLQESAETASSTMNPARQRLRERVWE